MIDTHACFMQCLRKIRGLDIIEGISYHELYSLQRILATVQKNGLVAIEIGSWKGCSSYFLAHVLSHLKGCKLYCIDTWKGNTGTWNIEEGGRFDIKKIFEYNVAEFSDIIIPINEDSKTAHTQFKDDSADFIFIDGDHTYDGMLADLTNYYPKLKKGGIISGHDSNSKFGMLSPKAQQEIGEYCDIDCVYVESLGKRVHCGVTVALFDFFDDDYLRTADEFSRAEEGVKNSIWWKIKS